MQSRILSIFLASLLASATQAATNTAVEDVLVTGTLAPQLALTSSVSVLDSKQIEVLNKTTVADLLKTLPGLLVEEQGGPGGLTAVSIRGGESNFTLVLVDGVAVNDPTNFRGGRF
jgi:vitamin B12 transporter